MPNAIVKCPQKKIRNFPSGATLFYHRLQFWLPAAEACLARRRGSRKFRSSEPRIRAAMPLKQRTRSMDKQLGFPGKSRATRAARRFDALLLASASIVWWTDAAGEFVEEQPYWQEYTGQSWDDHRGSGWASSLHPDDRQSIMADWASAVASGAPYFTQGRIWSAKHRDYRAFQMRAIPINDETGQIEEWLGALTDVQDTIDIKVLLDRTQADLADSLKALRASEARSRAHLTDLQAADVQLARNSSALKKLNEASSRLLQERELHAWLKEVLRAAIELLKADKGVIRLFDATRKTLVIAAHHGFEQPFLDLFKEVSAEYDTCCGRATRSGRRAIIEDVEADEGFAPFRTVASAAGFRAVQATPLVGRAGTPLGILSTHFRNVHRPTTHELDLLDLCARQAADFIERHRNDEALRESEERYEGIYQHASMGIAIWDLGGRMVSCNPAYCDMRGYSEDELRGLSFEAIVHPEDRERHACEVKKLISQQIPSFEIENRCLSKDGKVSWVHKHVSLLRDGAGRPANIITLATNITERKQHEEQIDLLLREVNHRSKNLLSLVQAIAQQTVNTRPDDFLPRFQARVQALAASHDILVGNKWKGADLHELARSQLAHFRDLMDKRIEIAGPPVFASASAAQALGMAFHELATNATKYGALSDESGRVDLGWKTVQSAEGEEVFVIEWIERGGPPAAAPSSRGFGSTVICRLAERSLDANVELHFPSTGLTWRLQCPRGVVEERAAGAVPKPKAPEPHEASGRRLRVLVVEDEAIVAFEIEQNLQEAGFEVVGPAARVAEALELLKEFGCDAAVLDINLGAETSEPIARLLSDKGTPFVTVSGYSQDQRPSGFSGGAFLTKPLRAELLVAQLRQCTAEQARGLRSN
jgi:PAS domain S-box-containing protein